LIISNLEVKFELLEKKHIGIDQNLKLKQKHMMDVYYGTYIFRIIDIWNNSTE